MAVAIGAMLANSSCGVRTVCKESAGGGVSRWCIEQNVGPGSEVWVHTRDGETHHGVYAGTREVDGAPTLFLLPYSLSGMAQQRDTARIELQEIRSINRVHEGSGTLKGFIFGAVLATFTVLTLLLIALGGHSD